MAKCSSVLQVLAVAVAVAAVDPEPKVEKPIVTIYYESLCPACIGFITEQFTPTFRQLYVNNLFDIQLVPFGKANTSDGGKTWSCQHSAEECYGNKIQACALKDIKTKNPSHFPEAQVSFVNCVMQNRLQQSDYPTRRCAAQRDAEVYETCANGEEGNTLLYEMMQITRSLQPPLQWVPTIVFNNEYSEKDTTNATTNFKGVLCEYLNEPKPNACTQTSPTVSTEVLPTTASGNTV